MRIESSRLRRERTPFIGRRRELGRIHEAFDKGAELVTLTGPSGIGKTRLAWQIAAKLTEAFDDYGGAWFCNLLGYSNPEDLEVIVARTVGLSQQHGDELLHGLANRGPLLLVLDNADSLAAASAELLSRWIDRCVELRILLTSLVPTRARGEVVIELQPLELDDAIALYKDRARRAWIDRSVPSNEDQEVQELVHRLDRVPLAIELAAARVRVLPPRTILSMLEKRLELLRSPDSSPASTRSRLSRRSSLLGSLELTWRHLEPHEQLVLARAVVFEHDFTADAAAAVLWPRSKERDAPAIEEILDGLQRKALILQKECDPPRFQLLETIKEFALRELHELGAWDEMVRSHADYFLGRPEAQKSYGRRPERPEAIPWLQAERENLLAIHRRFLSAAPDLAARAGIALSALFTFEGPSSADTVTIEATLAAAKRSGDSKLILAAMETLSLAHFRHGSHDQAIELMEAQAALARSNGEREVEAFSLPRLALLLLARGKHEECREVLREADRLVVDLDQPGLDGLLHFSKGTVAFLGGDLDLAEAELRRSIELDSEHLEKGNALNSAHNLGLVLSRKGRHQEGRRVLHEALEVGRAVQYRPFEVHILTGLLAIELVAGSHDEAMAAGKRALAIFREQGNRYGEGLILSQLGLAALLHSDLDQAQEWLLGAEERLLPIDEEGPQQNLQFFLAALAAKQGEVAEARRLLDRARARSDAAPGSSGPILELIQTLIDVVEARHAHATEPNTSRAKLDEARARLAGIEIDVPLYSYLRTLPRLVEDELAAWEAGAPFSPRPSSAPTITVSPDFTRFRFGDGEPISLGRRPALRGIFTALAQGRMEQPGVAVGLERLAAAGWPNEPDPSAITSRVNHVIWLLRDLGLRKLVRTEPYGFLLDPEFPIRIVER